MKALVCTFVIVLLVVSGCAESKKTGSTVSGTRTYDRLCIDGVEYLYGVKGYGHVMTAHMKTDGGLYLCDN